MQTRKATCLQTTKTFLRSGVHVVMMNAKVDGKQCVSKRVPLAIRCLRGRRLLSVVMDSCSWATSRHSRQTRSEVGGWIPLKVGGDQKGNLAVVLLMGH